MARQSKTAREQAEEIFIKYAHAYLLVRDHRAAAIGVGVDPARVEEFLDTAKSCVTAQKIILEDATFIPDFKQPDKVREAILQQLWREARSNHSATGAGARVSALKAIGEISGLVDPEGASKANTAGGMLMVPVMSMEQWEKACVKAQQTLRAANHD